MKDLSYERLVRSRNVWQQRFLFIPKFLSSRHVAGAFGDDDDDDDYRDNDSYFWFVVENPEHGSRVCTNNTTLGVPSYPTQHVLQVELCTICRADNIQNNSV